VNCRCGEHAHSECDYYPKPNVFGFHNVFRRTEAEERDCRYCQSQWRIEKQRVCYFPDDEFVTMSVREQRMIVVRPVTPNGD
jgi:hypothetical protein